jgi:serine/threonine-protein kinase
MGAVYEARDASGGSVALKVLILDATDDRLARFRIEAQSAARVDHPNVARVRQLGRDPRTGEAFLTTELLTGGSLQDRLRAEGRLSWREAARIGAQIATGLDAIHAAGLVHRDLKPANVLFDGSGRPKIADFGLARITESVAQRLTKTGEILGTPEYLAPEQADSSKSAGPPADVYALGITLHALVAGVPPFAGASSHEILVKHFTHAPPGLGQLVAGVPPVLESVVLRLLSKNPEERGTAAVAARELEAIARGDVGPARRLGRGPIVAAACLVVGAITVGIAFAGRGTPPVTPPSVGPTPSRPSRPAWFDALDERARPPFPLPEGLDLGEVPGEYVNKKDGSVLVFVPAGSFRMGHDTVYSDAKASKLGVQDTIADSAPAHEVALSAYFIGKLEVSVEQFSRFVRENPGFKTEAKRQGGGVVYLWTPDRTDGWGEFRLVPGASYTTPEGDLDRRLAEPNEPVVQVSWDDAYAYCKWAGLALPSEAQWERAAIWDPRTGRARTYSWGDEPPKARVANLRDRAFCRAMNEEVESWLETYDDGFPRRAPVGSFPEGASPCGALDMTGNACEWCQDGFDPRFYGSGPRTDPVCDAAARRMIRGGSWTNYRFFLIGCVRLHGPHDWHANDLGFRVARSVDARPR